MKNKFEILKTIDVTDDVIVIVAKKIKEEPKHCKDCPNCKKYSALGIYFCGKYKGVVDADDVCIEVGM